MALIKRHDIVQTNLVIADRKQDINELEKEKDSCADFTSSEQDRILQDLHTIETQTCRQKANLAVDHQRFLKAEFNDTWTAIVGAAKGTSMGATLKVNKRKFVGKHLKMHIVRDGEDGDAGEEGDYITYINLTPTSINGFQALKKKWQYFKINKISVKFVSNSANNLSPIVCRYMPPLGKEGDVTKLNADYVTKYAESVGTTSGYVSLHMPPCLVKKGEFNKDNEFQYGENGYCLPNLNKDRMLCSYEEDKFYLDYGTLIIESKNIGTTQNVIAQIHYAIDFYSGYDYESASINPENPDDPDHPDDGGDDKPDDGTSPGGEGNSNIPDDVPDDGLHPRGSYAKSFRRTKK